MSEQENILNRASQVFPQGNLGNVNYDLVISKGIGSRVWDQNGYEYVDYLLGSGPMIVGHANPRVNQVVINQVSKGSTFFITNDLSILLAEESISAVPCADKIRYCSTGSEATLYAMRLARAFTKKDKILKFEGGYHGMNDYALMSMYPKALNEFPLAEPDSAGIPKSLQSEVLVAPFNDLETTQNIVSEHCSEIGGIIVEPLQRLIPPIPGFLQGLRQIADNFEIPLIFDETVTGFRLAYGGAQEFYGVTPDLCTLGKAIGGGFPLTAVAGKNEYMLNLDKDLAEADSFLPQVGTLSGNPIACAAGLETLAILKEEGTYQKMFGYGNTIKSYLEQRFLSEGIECVVQGEDVLFDIFFCDSKTQINDYRSTLSADSGLLEKFNRSLLNSGVLKGASKFYFSSEHNDDDLKITIQAIDKAVNEFKV